MSVLEERATRPRTYGVVYYDGCTWVVNLARGDQPIGYFEGHEEDLAEQAAGILGLAAAQSRPNNRGLKRYRRAQALKEKVNSLPGWTWWRP